MRIHVDETAWVQSMIDEGLASQTLYQDPRGVINEIIAEERLRQDKQRRLGDAADRPTRLAYKKLTR